LAVDGHQHFWNPGRLALPWLREEHAAISGAFEPEQLRQLMTAAGVEATILVQAANLDEDTDFMFEHAAKHDWIAAVVAWVALDDSAGVSERLEELESQQKLRGIRHLIHDEPDPHWILQPAVLESLALLEERGLILELPAVFPRHLRDVPELARSFPQLTIVIDHLAKPPVDPERFAIWARELEDAADCPNVAAKISGLNTTFEQGDWSAADLRPAIAVALGAFGSDRLLCGSDWPVALLNGDYERVWRETRRVVEELAPADSEQLLGGTARRLYRIESAEARLQKVEALDGAH
jgi:L-fuconolactonase